MDEQKVNIKITGDFVVNNGSFSISNIDPNLIEAFKKSDLNIVNLECPITNASAKYKIIKTGPHLKGESDQTYSILKRLNVHAVTLANNHLMDYGSKGLEDTLAFCNKKGIKTVGGGSTLEQATKVLRLTIKGYSFSIMNFAEHEWSIADESQGGANPLDIIENVQQIRFEKEISDFVVVIIHGGHEYYNLPSPRIVKQYRFYAENGADLIVGHHPHCISGYEVYNNVPIYYSLGNFVFTKPSSYGDWYEGLVLELLIDKHGLKTNIIPVEQDKNDYSIKLIEGEKRKQILKRISSYSEIIRDSQSLDEQWCLFVNDRSLNYLNYWSPLVFVSNKYLRFLMGKKSILTNIINKRGLSTYLNLIRCEAHRDLSKSILENYLKRFRR